MFALVLFYSYINYLKNEIYRNNWQDRYKIWSTVFFKSLFKKLDKITESLWFKNIDRVIHHNKLSRCQFYITRPEGSYFALNTFFFSHYFLWRFCQNFQSSNNEVYISGGCFQNSYSGILGGICQVRFIYFYNLISLQ